MILKWRPRMANSMVEGSHERVAEYLELAAHSHRAAGHHGKEDHQADTNIPKMGLNTPKGFRVVPRSSSEIGEVKWGSHRGIGLAAPPRRTPRTMKRFDQERSDL
jgi:hypothetical protein